MTTSAAPAPRRAERGMSWVSVLLLLAVTAGGYLGWVWIPILADQYEVKQATRDFMNRAVKDRDDPGLVSGLSQTLARIRRVRWVDEAGQAWESPAIDVPPEAISWERDVESRPPVLRVAFSYDRIVRYPWFDRVQTRTFHVQLENDLTVPNWDAR
jgi:hypothetical protein